MLSSPGLTEEGVEGIIATADGLVRRHLAVRLDPVLKTEQLPASIADLHTCLANVDAKSLTHVVKVCFDKEMQLL